MAATSMRSLSPATAAWRGSCTGSPAISDAPRRSPPKRFGGSHCKPPAANTNIEGWLYRTGLRLALDQLKKDRRRARYEALGSLFGLAASPHQVLEQTEERARVRQALGALKTD